MPQESALTISTLEHGSSPMDMGMENVDVPPPRYVWAAPGVTGFVAVVEPIK